VLNGLLQAVAKPRRFFALASFLVHCAELDESSASSQLHHRLLIVGERVSARPVYPSGSWKVGPEIARLVARSLRTRTSYQYCTVLMILN
jgi:hypothetical protein